MKRSFGNNVWAAGATAIALVLATACAASAQENGSYGDEFVTTGYGTATMNTAAVERIVRQTVAEMNSYGAASQGSCCAPAAQGCCGDPCCQQCCGHGGWYAGAELTYLRPHFDGDSSDDAQIELPDIEISNAVDWDHEPAPRFWVGYENCCGSGARIRYWTFDHASNTLQGFLFGELETITASLEMDVADFEFTRRWHFCDWSLEGAAGIRYARLQRSKVEVFDDFGEIFASLDDDDFEGYGPTFALEANSPMCFGGLSAFAGVRTSFLVGEVTRFDLELDNGFPVFLENEREHEDMWVVEMQVGLAYTRPCGCGHVFVSAALETQWWARAGHIIGQEDDDDDDIEDDLSLIGGTFGAGIAY